VDTSEQKTIEVAGQVKKRQKRSVEEKRRIIEETLVTGASVARTNKHLRVWCWWRELIARALCFGPSGAK
jgi:transposase-like protein